MRARIPAAGLVWLLCLGVAPGSGRRANAETDRVLIAHQPEPCVLAERFGLISARLEPEGSVARAVLQFRLDDSTGWYGVAMGMPRGRCAIDFPWPRQPPSGSSTRCALRTGHA